MLSTNLIYSILPTIVKENIELATFFALLSYVLFLINWVVTTGKQDARPGSILSGVRSLNAIRSLLPDWLEKLHLFSLATCTIGVFYLHYFEVVLLVRYEAPFVMAWFLLLYYHASSWNNNYARVRDELNSSSVAASLRPFKGSVLRFFITMPTTKNASNQVMFIPGEFDRQSSLCRAIDKVELAAVQKFNTCFVDWRLLVSFGPAHNAIHHSDALSERWRGHHFGKSRVVAAIIDPKPRFNALL